jgi:aspartate racemase
MHRTAPAIEAALTVPFLHIADPVAAAAPGPTIGLLGTAGTVRASFLRDRLAAAGLTVLLPPEDDVDHVDAAIFDELCRGVLSDATRADLRAVVRRLAARGADAVALCCTELELLLGPGDSPVPLLPSARLHVTAAVDAALAPDAAVV